MSELEVLVVKIEEPVIDHPNADTLSLVQIGGYTAIAKKNPDGSHRFHQGGLVVYIPEQAVLPETLMRSMDFWDLNKNRPQFKCIKAKRLREIFSQGILYTVDKLGEQYYIVEPTNSEIHVGQNSAQKHLFVNEGDDVAEFLGITKYEPKVPTSMAGRMTGEYINHTSRVDFESLQKIVNMFEEFEHVWVTEKLHGTQCIITWVKELSDPLLFGANGNIFVTSKGVSKGGFVYKNFPENADNLYVKILKQLLEDGLDDIFTELGEECETISLYGEIIGIGVQDLGYGVSPSEFRLFDISIDKEFGAPSTLKYTGHVFKVKTVPELYDGPFSMDKMIELRDGLETINGSHIREGIVIRGVGRHPRHGRKIVKLVSPAYLLRREGTEYN